MEYKLKMGFYTYIQFFIYNSSKEIMIRNSNSYIIKINENVMFRLREVKNPLAL